MNDLGHRALALGLLVERASLDAVKTLKSAGIRPILLKGPLQQSWLEPAGPARVSWDVDVLVSIRQLADAEAAVSALGYEPPVGPVDIGVEHSSVWVAEGRMPIEVHWSLVGADERKVWSVLSRETEQAELLGGQVEIPNEPARCAIVALHAAQHGIGLPAVFGDLEKALALVELGTWQRAAELARAMGGWMAFAGALSFTDRGKEILQELGAAPPELDRRHALNLLTPAPTSLGFYFLAHEPGARAKAAFLLRKVAPPPSFMRVRYPRARRSGLGLALSYLYRPFWLLRWAPPGLRSWQRAQRLARASHAGNDEQAGSPPDGAQ